MGSVARRHKAAALVRDGRVSLHSTGPERVHLDVKEYQVVYHRRERRWSCTCRYNTLTQSECYHIVAARIFLDQTIREKREGEDSQGKDL